MRNYDKIKTKPSNRYRAAAVTFHPTYKLQPRLHTRLGPEEEEAIRVRKTRPPIAADILPLVPLFVSETPLDFRPDILHHTPRIT